MRICVEWFDSCAPSRIRQSADDAQAYDVVTCISAAFWIIQGGNCSVITQSLGDREVGNLKAIPTCCVQSIKALSQAKAR